MSTVYYTSPSIIEIIVKESQIAQNSSSEDSCAQPTPSKPTIDIANSNSVS